MTRPLPGETADILIVDDNPSNLHLLSQTLGERGYRVRAVTRSGVLVPAFEVRTAPLVEGASE